MNTSQNIPWSRQGSRNIAGVTYQVAVSAYLLVFGRSGRLPVTSVTPEGMEDVDCRCGDGHSLLVQAKERGDGSGTLTCATVAEIFDHALPALEVRENARFALVTNAQLGSDLRFTNWSGTAQSILTPATCNSLLLAVADKGRAERANLFARGSLVFLERQLDVQVTQALCATYQIPPAVARIVYSLLLQDLGELAAAQRSKTPETAVSRHLADLDAMVHRVQEMVDVGQLDLAVRSGIVEPLDFVAASDIPPERFLLGVDTTPSHIAANLDILRPLLGSEINLSLQNDGYVVIAGPSGSGKSSLLWRSARNCEWAARKARILRIMPGDIAELVRWVRLQQPSPRAPLLLCADNLGRATTSGWTAAIEQLRGIPGVVILCAVRREDFNSSLVATAPVVIEPVLDLPLARSISQALQSRGIATHLDSDEAFTQSKQLLMEFLSLLLSGRRMREIVAGQVQDRLTPERQTEREALRYVCAAHCLGLSVPANTLVQVLGQPPDFYQAMSRLKSEHLLTENEQTEWVGLHELRSQLISEVLHSLPPPTEAATYAMLLKMLPAESQPILLRRYGYLSHAPIATLAPVVVELLTIEDVGCKRATALVDALRECESTRFARACLKVVREVPDPTGVSVQMRLTLALLVRETGFSMPLEAPEIQALAKALPDRPQSLVTQVLRQVGTGLLTNLAREADSDATANWLGSLEGYVDLTEAAGRDIWAAHSSAPTLLRGRILASLARLAKLEPRQIEQFAGRLETRIAEIARTHPNGLQASVSINEEEGVVGTVEVMVPSDVEATHQQAVAVAEQILALCPEAAVAEVITREPGGKEFIIAEDRRGYKRIPRKNLPRQAENRPQREVLSSAERLLAARFWTERLRLERDMARESLSLLEELPQRLLNRHDHAGRRREWRQRAAALAKQELPPSPHHDPDKNCTDPVEDALQNINGALSRLAENIESPSRGLWYGAAQQLRQTLPSLARAQTRVHPILPSIGEPISASLVEAVRHAADLLFTLTVEPETQRFRNRGSAADWSSVSARVVSDARNRQIEAELSALKALSKELGLTPEIASIRYEDPKSSQLLTDRWIVFLDWRAWPATSGFLRLPDELRPQMSFRTFIVAVEGAYPLPFLAVQFGQCQLFPVDSDEVKRCCEAVGKQCAVSPHLQTWDIGRDSLVEASRLNALHWRRPAAWRRQADLDLAKQWLEQGEASFARIPSAEIRTACRGLSAAVRAELANGGYPCASAVYTFPIDSPGNDDIQQLFWRLKLAIAECELKFEK